MADNKQDNNLSTYAGWLFKQPCDFIIGACKIEDLPLSEMPEVAFAGRSNVGKSSLLNALTNRKKLAKTSNTPGRTQQINFFNLNDEIMLVDLPGYGYAKASKVAKKNWNNMIKLYLHGRAQLFRVYILIDSRHGIKQNDQEFMKLMDSIGLSYMVVLTKIDKIKKEELENIKKSIEEQLQPHPAAFPTTIVTSSEKKVGVEELQCEILSLCDSRKNQTI